MCKRPTLAEWCMKVANTVAERSTCLHKQVGCILVTKEGIILSTGYNGPPKNVPHCTTCIVQETGNKGLCPAVHAEQNAMLYADPAKIYACYCTLEPCIHCTKLLMNTTCKLVVFQQKTGDQNSGRALWVEYHDPSTWRHRVYL
jgi:dCMP deaminase